MAPLFLGIDLSTQQLKALIISENLSLVHEAAVHFDRDLPRFGTTNGAVQGPRLGEVTSPVEMWLEAVDLLMDRIKQAGVELGNIVAISGAGQQHGSVYWSNDAERLLSSLNPQKSISSQLFPDAFSLSRAPIWQDSSTTQECRLLEEHVGGAQALADLTGSRAYERFTGNQIMKIRRMNPEAYARTSRVSLVSSFVPSLFVGRIVPMDIADASGMNLMDIVSCKWNESLLEACGGPELRRKIGSEPVLGGTILGKVSSWWVERWGLSPDCIISSFTGDNPATVISFSAPGDALLSLGTSTTFLLSIPPSGTPPKRFTTSHLLAHPTSTAGKIAMLCYKNGALAREHVRDKYANGDWNRFNESIEGTVPGNDGLFGLYFPLPEIIPPNVVGNFFFTTKLSDDGQISVLPAEDIPSNAHPRAIVESQLLSIRSRIAAILPENSPPLQRLVITGGSSANLTIRQLAANIFRMKVYVSSTKEAAGMGGALLAKYAWWKNQEGGTGTYEEMIGDSGVGLQCVAVPDEAASDAYDKLVSVYAACEEKVVEAQKK